MRIPLVLCSILLVLAPVISRADVVRTEPHIMFYYDIPFSGGSHNSDSGFGLRLDRINVDRSSAIHVVAPRMSTSPALFDFRAGTRGIEKFTVGGMDYLHVLYVNQADNKGKSDSNGKPEKEKLSIKKLLHETPVGWLIGAAIGVVLISGAAQ